MTDSTSQTPSLFDIIAWVETKNNPHAMRFERATYERIDVAPSAATMNVLSRIARINQCSMGTAHMIYSTSFGATQMMGFNLYADNAPAHDADVVTFMSDPIMQAAMFDSFLTTNNMHCTILELATQPIMRHGFAVTYNGPGAPDAYAAQIVYALQHFGIEVAQ